MPVETLLLGPLNKGTNRKPLEKSFAEADTSRQLINWSIKLNKFDIDYIPRNTVKGQVLANFIVEFVSLP